MTDFRILRDLPTAALRFADHAIDTHVVDDVAHAAITRTKGVVNPLHILGTGPLNRGIFTPELFEKASSQVIRGNGSSAFDDAVRSLHELGSRHNVQGISLGSNPNHYGGIMFVDDIGYGSGYPTLQRLAESAGHQLPTPIRGKFTAEQTAVLDKGRDIAIDIDAAARRVLDFVDAPA